ASLKRELSAKGIEFQSETDTEALTNLVAYLYKLALNEGAERSTSTLLTALRAALTQVEGTYGIAMICTDFPDQIFGARKGSPLVVGIGRKENFIASDIAAFAGRTQDVIYLRDNEVVHLNAETFTV
ncbi:glutamine--fructose-6-phosphate aminotransferase, partial [Arthrospira platensis SPKY1]|nr:glutamine--fructose-6-phosphate aminotransferase [Arthrospira platensis SPKY1]